MCDEERFSRQFHAIMVKCPCNLDPIAFYIEKLGGGGVTRVYFVHIFGLKHKIYGLSKSKKVHPFFALK